MAVRVHDRLAFHVVNHARRVEVRDVLGAVVARGVEHARLRHRRQV